MMIFAIKKLSSGSVNLRKRKNKYLININFKIIVSGEWNKFANLSLIILKQEINGELKHFTDVRIISSVDSLLATDVLKQVRDTCVSIASRMCHERVHQWINSHVNIGVFLKDFDAEARQFFASQSKKAKQKPMFALPLYGKDLKHNSEACSGVELVENIRSYCWNVLEKPNTITVDHLVNLIKSIHQSVNERCDLNDGILFLINRMLVDFFILLVGNRADLVISSDIVGDFCSLWKKCINDENLFKTLVSPRNIFMITHSLNVDLSWKAFEKFMLTLLCEKLLTYETFAMQISTVERDKLNKDTLSYLGTCLETARMHKDWQK